jgi:hypothetical protein
MENMPLSKIYENANRAAKFQELVDRLTDSTKTINDNAKDTMTNTEYDFLRPWADKHHNTQRKFGELQDLSSGYQGSTAYLKGIDPNRQHELVGNDTTTLALLYAINNKRKTGSDSLIDKYINRINDDRSSQSSGQDNLIDELLMVMTKEYHGLDKLTILRNAPSSNRPKGLFEELYQYRCQLNPIEGISARKYLNEIIEIKDVSGTDTFYYGTDEIYRKNNLLTVKAGKTEIEQLLYYGDVSTNIGKKSLANSCNP